MKTVECKKLRRGLGLTRAQHGAGNIENREFGVIPRELLNGLVGAFHLAPAIPTSWRGFNGDEVNRKLALLSPKFRDELLKLIDHHFGRFFRPFCQVVVACIDDDGPRRIGGDDAIGIVENVLHVRAPEAPLKNGQRIHVGFEAIPEADA